MYAMNRYRKPIIIVYYKNNRTQRIKEMFSMNYIPLSAAMPKLN